MVKFLYGITYVSLILLGGLRIFGPTVVKLKPMMPLKEQITSSNTTYIVNDAFDLVGDTLVIPEDCRLRFKNGGIRNGCLVFKNTELKGKIHIDCDLKGSLQNEVINLDWFVCGAASANEVIDESEKIQSIVDLNCEKLVFGEGYYSLHNVRLPNTYIIEGNKTIILPAIFEQKEYDFNFLKNVFYAEDVDKITVSGICFKGKTTKTILPDFKSDSIYGEPLIWINKGEIVNIDGCIFKDIENCTYCNSAYNAYNKKQGSCLCCWDVSEVNFINNEQVNCRHEEQVWIIGVQKPIMDLNVYSIGNYIHDMEPGPNSSAFTCVAGTCLFENNKVERYVYPGSMFNLYAKKLIIRKNTIKESYCSSVFDACEYRYHHNDEIELIDNHVEAINSALLVSQSEKVTIKNNYFKGVGLYYSSNYRVQGRSKYPYWYTIEKDVLPTDSETLIEGNVADFTFYDGSRSISGTKADYGTGEIKEPQRYSRTGNNYGCGIFIHPNEAKAENIVIKNNNFTSFESLDGITDDNNLKGVHPQTIKLLNTENVTISGNIFNGAYEIYGADGICSCITVYGYPDIMESNLKTGESGELISKAGTYKIEDNTFNVKDTSFCVIAFFPRKNAMRDTPLSFDRIIINNNDMPPKSVPYYKSGKVIIKEESIH